MKNLSIVLPYRPSEDGYRSAIFDWIYKRYEQLFPDSEIIVCDSNDEQFSRSKSRNIGVDQSTKKFILLADADIIPFKQFIESGIFDINNGVSWMILYDNDLYFNADKSSSKIILNSDPISEIIPSQIIWEHKITSWAGQLLFKREDFYEIGGYDERFTGWGYEDNAFQVAADTILGQHKRVRNAWTIHLWHPYSHDSTFGQPMIRYNRNLYNNYVRCSNSKEQMLDLIRSRNV